MSDLHDRTDGGVVASNMGLRRGSVAGRRFAPSIGSWLLLLLALGFAVLRPLAAQEATIPIEVWKSTDCRPYEQWLKEMEAGGFRVRVNEGGNEAARAGLGIPAVLASCQTALVAGYAVEGQVPPTEVRRLLEEKPEAVGLALSAAPADLTAAGAAKPDTRPGPAVVLLVRADGTTTIYRDYR
jgi:hypothetical protein